jgi:alpha-D-ribose 1-methylphosphonate 5-triphosphate synthase subunit PhnH
MIAALLPAFSDPVLQAQSVFRVVMNALARPGRAEKLECELVPPKPLSAGAAAIALTLADYETPLWLDPSLADADGVLNWLRFHTGAPMCQSPAQAAFALVSDARVLPDFATFSQGMEDYPDRSATLIVQVDSLSSGPELRLSGPGVKGTQVLRATPLPADFVDRAVANHSRFPQGVDLLLVSPSAVIGIPRSTLVASRD